MQKMTCFESTAIIIVAECENNLYDARKQDRMLLTQLSLFNIPTITKCTILKLYENVGPITSVI